MKFRPGVQVSAVVVAVLLAVPVAPLAAAPPTTVKLIQADNEIPEDQLLDVGILVFEHGLPPEGEDPEAEDKLEEKGIYRDVRRAEARFFPVHLANTLQLSGQWGAVRVVPSSTDAVDIVISATILESNGRELALEVEAVDTSGEVWLDRKYKQKADPRGYAEQEEGVQPVDPFARVYNEIANDLLEARREMSADEIRELRWISQLHFAADLAPSAFRGYVSNNRKGRTELAKLPADGDPMLDRVIRIRERDYLLIDTFHDQYLTFYDEMALSYVEWRSYSYEEEVALAKLRKQARTAKILGALAILGGIVADSGSTAEDVARQGAIIGGQIALQVGMAKGQEAKIHRAAIQELAGSFDAEISPMVLRVEGQTLRLSGTAETQYNEWRELLREIWQGEVGLPVDPDNPDQVLEAESPQG